MVAFSGGVDSAVVVVAAARALGTEHVTAVTAVSSSFPAGEVGAARAVASALGVFHRTVDTHELEREAYARNDGMRCFHCKTELYATLRRLPELLRDGAAPHAAGDAVILAGANADDEGDFRPGLLAAGPHGVRNPLLAEGVGKAEVRAIARHLGLPVAEKPALACLSSRVAFGIRITPELLARIDGAERAVRRLGFDPVRVRHFGERMTIEVEPASVERLLAHPSLPALLQELRVGGGWSDVDVDPEGYRPGSMNATLVNVGPAPARRSRTGGGGPAHQEADGEGR